MPNPGLSPHEHERRLAVVQRHIATGYGWVTRAAKDLGIDRTTLHSWCKANGVSADGPEAQIADGFALKGYSEFTKTEHGTPIWLKTVKAEQDYWAAVIEVINARPVRQLDIPAPPRPDLRRARRCAVAQYRGRAHRDARP